MISYWKIFRNLSSLLCNLTYLSLPNSFLFLSRFSVSLKSLDNYFFRWFAYKSLFSRFSVLISYNMWSSNHFAISNCFPSFSGCRFFRVRIQGLGSGSSVRVLVLEEAPENYETLMILQLNYKKLICFLNNWGWDLKILDGNFPWIISCILSILFLMCCIVTMETFCKKWNAGQLSLVALHWLFPDNCAFISHIWSTTSENNSFLKLQPSILSLSPFI